MPTRSTTRSSLTSTDASGLFSQADAGRNAQPGEWISAHCDGGARGNPGPAGYGALILGPDGGVLSELSEFLGNRTNNYAEYSGLLGCLAWAIERGHKRLRIVSDSELMVKQIQGKYQVKSPDLKVLYDEAKRRIARLDAFEISHALRHKNKDADRLANEAMDRGMRRGVDGVETRPAVPQRPAAPQVPIGRQVAPVAAKTSAAQTMLRGFTRDGVVHVLGAAKLPDGIFVKVILE